MREMKQVKQPKMRMILMIAIAGLGACAEFPQLDDRIDAAALAADYPTLQPLDPLLAKAANQKAQLPPHPRRVLIAALGPFAPALHVYAAPSLMPQHVPVCDAALRCPPQFGKPAPTHPN